MLTFLTNSVRGLFSQKLTLGRYQLNHYSKMASTIPTKVVKDMSDSEFKDWIGSFDTVMTDCDGVLWTGATAIKGSPEVINKFRELGKRVFYVTNNSTKHRREYKDKVDSLGFGGDIDEIIGTAYLAALHLDQSGFDKTKKVYVVGSTGITQELDDVGIQYLPIGPDPSPTEWGLDRLKGTNLDLDPAVGAVLVGFDLHLSFVKMMKAASYLSHSEVEFLATNTDAQFPMKNSRVVVPGTGSMVAAVETAAGRKPVVLGKPSRFMFDIVQKRHPSIKPERTIMIGDRADTDILLGKNCGLQTLMVGSGVHSLNHIADWVKSENSEERRQVPDKFADCLGDLLERLNKL